VTPDADEFVLGANAFNEPPSQGNQFYMARIAVTYVGTSTGNPAHELNPQAVGALSTSYTVFNNMCGYGDYPDNLILATELFSGGSAEYNVCWEVDSDDQDSLVMYIESNVQFNANPVWFSLGNPIEVAVDPDATTVTAVRTATETPVPTVAQSIDTGTTATSRDNPAPIGQPVTVGDYQITVTAVTLNSTDAYAGSAYMEPPPPGEQFVVASISVTYTGATSGAPPQDLDFNAVGALSKSYSASMNLCGIGDLSGHVLLATELFAGGSGEYYVCWQIDSEDQSSLVMYVSSWSRPNDEPAWFSLQP
jgi:hypothetical protein